MNLRRVLVGLSAGLVLAAPLALPSVTEASVTRAGISAPDAARPTVGALAAATEVASGESTTLTATVSGAAENDVVVAAIRADDGWTEVAREPAGADGVHTFVVTPPNLGPMVYRVGVLRDSELVAYSDAVRVLGVIAAEPDPVLAGGTVRLRGVLPTAVARPVGLQVQTAAGGWRLIDTDVSAADGSVVFVEVAPRSARVRFVAPARTIGGIEYAALASAPVDVTVTAPVPAPGPTVAP